MTATAKAPTAPDVDAQLNALQQRIDENQKQADAVKEARRNKIHEQLKRGDPIADEDLSGARAKVG